MAKQEDFADVFEDFVRSGKEADAAIEAAVEAARPALREGTAFHAQHGRFARRGRAAIGSLMKMLWPRRRKIWSLRTFHEFLHWKDAVCTVESSRTDVFVPCTFLDVLEPL